jgi:hypothetical protein
VIKAISARFAAPEVEAWEKLMPVEIAARCRVRAEAAIALAEGHSPDLSIAYFEAAEASMQLADAVEWAAQKTTRVRSHAAIAA